MDGNIAVPVETPEELAAASEVLAKSIARWTGNENQMDTAIPGLRLSRWATPTEPTSYTLKSSICLIAQGAKRVLLGEETFVYDAASFLISSVDLPVVANIIEASNEKTYLGLILELDLREISQLIVDSGLPLNRSRQAQKGIAVGQLSLPLFSAFQRLPSSARPPAPSGPDSAATAEPVVSGAPVEGTSAVVLMAPETVGHRRRSHNSAPRAAGHAPVLRNSGGS